MCPDKTKKSIQRRIYNKISIKTEVHCYVLSDEHSKNSKTTLTGEALDRH